MFIFLISAFCYQLSAANWSYPGCDDVTDNDFTQEILIGRTTRLKPKLVDQTLLEPIELDLISDGAGGVDIYFVQRQGGLKFYDASENTVSEIGKIDVDDTKDCGLVGIVLSPDFKKTGWIYLFYTPKVPSKNDQVYGVYRYTLKNNILDPGTKKTIFEEAVRYDTPWHTGGSMQFDKYGDLWVACGKNANDDPGSINESDKWKSCEYSSSYFKSARGGLIRIHPIPFSDAENPEWGKGRTYTIPKGNLGDYFALKYTAENNPIRAAEFRDTSQVSPEIFAKGLRNPWTLTIEPVKRWVAWGENGINRKHNHEEHNFTLTPGFFGYPYFAGNPEITQCDGGGATCKSGYNISAQMSTKLEMDPLSPVNLSKWNDGLKNLPPAIPSVYTYQQSSAMTGPIYRYDGDLQSSIKFPPHFHNKWFLFDFNRGDKAKKEGDFQNKGVTKTITMDVERIKAVEVKDIFQAPTHNLYGVLDAEMGPDGAMYLINYAGWFSSNLLTNISRMVYSAKNKCHPPTPRLEEKVNPNVYYPPAGYGCKNSGDPNFDQKAYAHDEKSCKTTMSAGGKSLRRIGVEIKQEAVHIKAQGKHAVTVYTIEGHPIESFNGQGHQLYDISDLKPNSVYVVKAATSNGVVARKFFKF